ncbi:esterase family protein [Paenibacillus sp. NEAU-GSW1]|uniref:alpha/beta hydrolase n=1 Tax=Paenibacillus sp. NEAU-GSW1 TaxID=2682486 RepID=UPI0012E10249|nr:alpha/beta hydrolase-fold protein [Paenibacillus sp. NEAU-GSW1]MUT68253.1 esterase [Paenibacillus sp. NEAU-GSW1]
MKNLDNKGIPDAYMKAAASGKQGIVREFSYPVNNYINKERQLVTDRLIDTREAGRPTVSGETIMKNCNVYFPAGYDDRDVDTRYHVLYLLHGVGGDQYEWLRGSGSESGRPILCNIIDNLIANGDIDPIIMVMPNGRSTHDWTDRTFNSEGTNMLGFYYFDYELRYDLIPFIESTFKTYANISETSPEAVEYNRMHRAIAGLSMGGMQVLNLILGGFRCDSAAITGMVSEWGNGLVTTVPARGMTDLFAYAGAFSNAPSSSNGKQLGASIALNGHRLRLLYMTCGDADGVSIDCYNKSIDQLTDNGGDYIDAYCHVLIKDGVHDFQVWNHGAYQFTRMSFRNVEAH